MRRLCDRRVQSPTPPLTAGRLDLGLDLSSSRSRLGPRQRQAGAASSCSPGPCWRRRPCRASPARRCPTPAARRRCRSGTPGRRGSCATPRCTCTCSASPGAPAPRAAPRPRSSSLGPVARPPSRGQLHHRWDDAAGFIPITKAAQVTSDIQKFVFAYCQVHGLNSELQLLAAEQFSKRLQQEAGRHADGGGGDLMAPVRATAALLQRSVEWEITTRSSARC